MIHDLITACIILATGVTIVHPEDGGTYNGDWLTLRALVENDESEPDSVMYSLNSLPGISIPRLSTDWYTYMGDHHRTGFSESPAPQDDTILWTAPVTGDTHEFCGPVVADGMVYFVSDEQSIAYGLDALTGQVIWQYDVVDDVDDAVTWYEGRVYVAADSAWCLDAATGERIWAWKGTPGEKMNGNPPVEDGVAYFTYTPTWSSLRVCALDAVTGDDIWITDIPYYTTGCATLWQDHLLVPTYLGSLYSLDIETGSIEWENSDSFQGYWDSSPVVVDGMIYIGGFDGIFRCIDALEGQTVWQRDISPGQNYLAATPAYHDGSLFFADQVDTFHCLDAYGGEILWEVPGMQHGSPGTADGTVFYGQGADALDFGGITALDETTGQEIWRYQTGNTNVFSSPAITDGIVYIAGMDWNLYAFGTGPKYTYLDDLYAQTGPNQLIVTSWDGGLPLAADTVSFTVTGTGLPPFAAEVIAVSASPNPARSTVTISYGLSIAGSTSVEVFDLSGRSIRSIRDGWTGQGMHTVSWDGRDEDGSMVPSGMYYAVVTIEGAAGIASICMIR